LLRHNIFAIYPHHQLLKAFLYRLFPRANEMETCNGTFIFLLNLVVHDAPINTVFIYSIIAILKPQGMSVDYASRLALLPVCCKRKVRPYGGNNHSGEKTCCLPRQIPG